MYMFDSKIALFFKEIPYLVLSVSFSTHAEGTHNTHHSIYHRSRDVAQENSSATSIIERLSKPNTRALGPQRVAHDDAREPRRGFQITPHTNSFVVTQIDFRTCIAA